ncbi:hypothetical protein, partial [Clostridium sp.]|uniref:hypothetical protein n=1 Tax=Clostridium sp. TaxID=1506 RepID=UPI002FCCA720
AYEELFLLNSYTKEELKLMAETMSLLNINYFGGTTGAIRDQVINSEGYNLWVESDENFFKEYVRNMIQDSSTNNNKLEVPKQDMGK